MNRLFLLLGAMLFVAQSPARAATHICWVERVTEADGAMRLFMREGYEFAVRGITRPDGTRLGARRNFDGSFDLKEYDTVVLSTLPHDACTGRVTRPGDALGLALEANNCMPRIGCVQARDFVRDE